MTLEEENVILSYLSPFSLHEYHPKYHFRTRLHSSRMCTTHALTVSWGVWGCTCLVLGVYLPSPGGVCTCLVLGGTCLVRRGTCLVLGGCTGQVLPLWTEFLTHASENITLPQTSFAVGKDGKQRLKTQDRGAANIYS